MKKLFIFSVIMICIQVAVSQTVTQKIDTIYYDTNWKGVPVKSFAAYMRIAYMSNDIHYGNICKDFYISGELQGESTPVYIDKYDDSKSKWKGKIANYYKSGKKAADGFKNDSSKLEGIQTEYYETGSKKNISNFKNGIIEGEIIEYYENGKIKNTALFKNGMVQNMISYYENGAIKAKGLFKNGELNGTKCEYYENGSGFVETEMLNGQPINDFVTNVDVNGNRTKYDKEMKNIIQETPTQNEKKSTVSNGITYYYYQMNGIFLAVNVHIIDEYGKYYLASIVVGNNRGQSFIFETDKITASVEKGDKIYDCKVFSSNEYSNIVGKKQRSRSNWNAFGERVAAMNAGASNSSTSTLSAGLGANNRGNVAAVVGASNSQTKSYNGGNQYQANQIAQQNVSQYNNQLNQYRNALDQGYLKSNDIESGKSITGNINIKYQKGDRFVLNIPLNGKIYPFGWKIGD